MKFPGVECLTSSYTQDDIDGLSTVMQSTLLASPATALRWCKVDPSEAREFLRKANNSTLERDFKLDCITKMKDYGDLPAARHTAQLVVRDQDLKSTNSDIVSHAGYYYYPAFPAPTDEDVAEKTSGSKSWPAGFATELGTLLNHMVHTTLSRVFEGLPCFALESISTLTPTYLGKGLARQQVEWVYPYADHFNIPVILAASPLGLGLYRKCGFEEFNQHDIVVDLIPFGGDDVHRNVVMVRWPQNSEELPPAWKDWRLRNPATS